MATATCKLMYNITIHMTGYGVRILLTETNYTPASLQADINGLVQQARSKRFNNELARHQQSLLLRARRVGEQIPVAVRPHW